VDFGHFYGNLGAAAPGALQGVQNAQDMQARQFNMQQARDREARQQAAFNAQKAADAAYRQTLQSVYGQQQPMPQSPMPGQASVPMVQPAIAPYQAMPTTPVPQGVPPAANLTQSAVQGVQLPQKPTVAKQLDMQAVMSNAPKDPEAFDIYMAKMAPLLKPKNEWSEPTEMNGTIVQKNATTGEVRQVFKPVAEKGEWSEPFQLNGATVQRNEKTKEVRKITAPPGGAGGGAGNLGHLNAFMARETKDLAPITDGQMKSAKIIALLDSGNAVATPQVQQALSDLYSHLRATTQIYADNKSFGNVEQRLANSINRFLSGKYSSDDKKMIRDLVTEMNDKVFAPARGNVVKNYKKQAKAFGYDPDVAEIQNPYEAASPAAKPTPQTSSAPPAGFTVLE